MTGDEVVALSKRHTLFEWAVLGISAAALLWGREFAAGFPADPVGSFAIVMANALLPDTIVKERAKASADEG